MSISCTSNKKGSQCFALPAPNINTRQRSFASLSPVLKLMPRLNLPFVPSAPDFSLLTLAPQCHAFSWFLLFRVDFARWMQSAVRCIYVFMYAITMVSHYYRTVSMLHIYTIMTSVSCILLSILLYSDIRVVYKFNVRPTLLYNYTFSRS